MKHFLKVLLIFFCCYPNLSAYAYDIYKEGYILSLKGDTTKGFLLVQIGRNASEKCIFKPSADGASKIYQPSEIAGYRYLDSKYYVSKEINTDSTTKKAVFLEFLIKGMANIYYYVGNDGEHYYIEKLPQRIVELTEKEVTFEDEVGVHIIPKRYKGKLSAVLQDCPGIQNEIQETRLTHNSLIKLTKDYHQRVCNSESCIIYEKGNNSATVKFGVLMGLSKNQYNFGNEIISNYGNNYQIGAALKISNIFMFNRHLNLKANFIFEKDSKTYSLSLCNGVHNYSITNNNVRQYLNDINYGGNGIPILKSINGDLNVIDLKIPISLNYDFNVAKNTIFTLGMGISNKIILSQNKNFQVDEFYACYGRSINSLLTGVNATTGIEGNWFGKQTFFVNVGYEYLVDFRSRLAGYLKLLNSQASVQIGMYF